MEEASGDRADSTATGNTLTDVNTVTQAVGKVGNCAVFTLANSERLTHVHNASLSCGNIDFTFCAWVYFTGAAYHAILAKNAAQGEYSLKYETEVGRIMWYIFDSGGASTIQINSDSIVASTWYFVCAWFNAATGYGYISIDDGIPTSDLKGNNPATDALAGFTMGSDQAAVYWNGSIDQVGFWKRVLTATEITWLYNAGNGRSYAEIVAYTG